MIKKSFALKEVDIRTYSPLTLAYIGDAVYDLIFRTMVVQKGNTSVNKLHNQTIQYVKAPAQAVLAEKILDRLSPEEFAVYKRGRNAKPYTMAKNATMEEYKKATGLEALTGYLYLTNQMERALELIRMGLQDEGGLDLAGRSAEPVPHLAKQPVRHAAGGNGERYGRKTDKRIAGGGQESGDGSFARGKAG